jgi:hypothetical protein
MDGIMKLIIRKLVCNAVCREFRKFLKAFWNLEEEGKADDVRSGRDGMYWDFLLSSTSRSISFYKKLT